MFKYLQIFLTNIFFSSLLIHSSLFAQDWSIEPSDFEYNAAMTAQVLLNDNVVSSGTLAAFVGDEIRGLADASTATIWSVSWARCV